MGDEMEPVPVVEDPTQQLVPYREVTDAEFSVRAAETFTAERLDPGVLLLAGPCPRCAAVISIPIFNQVFRQGGTVGTGRRLETVMCTCGEPHQDRPDAYLGCGAYWTFELSEDPS